MILDLFCLASGSGEVKVGCPGPLLWICAPDKITAKMLEFKGRQIAIPKSLQHIALNMTKKMFKLAMQIFLYSCFCCPSIQYITFELEMWSIT